MKYQIRPLRRARNDVDQILRWIAHERKSPQGAANWLRAYEQAAKSLANFPERYGAAEENEAVDIEIQQFFFKTRRGRVYRGIFTVAADEILILRVRGPGQPPLEPDELKLD